MARFRARRTGLVEGEGEGERGVLRARHVIIHFENSAPRRLRTTEEAAEMRLRVRCEAVTKHDKLMAGMR